MSLPKHSFSFQHIQNSQLILLIPFRMVKMTTIAVNKQSKMLLNKLFWIPNFGEVKNSERKENAKKKEEKNILPKFVNIFPF